MGPVAPRRVCLYLPDLSGGGGEMFAIKLAGELRRRGIEVDFFLARREGPLLAEVPAGCEVFAAAGLALRKKFGPLVRYLRARRPDALLSNMDPSNVAGLARVVSRVPVHVVMVLHNTLSEEMKLVAPHRRRLFRVARHLYRLADAMVAVSEGLARDAAAVIPFVRHKLHVIANPVVSDTLLAAAREPVDHPWLRGGEVPVTLAVGRLHPQKDFPTLLRAFRIVCGRRPARLIILGTGGERERLVEEIGQLGLGDDVALPGFVANPWAWMSKASVLALSSVWEGLPTVLIEALAVGTPVVATDCPHGPREILDGGRYGRLVPVGDADGLAAALLATLDEPRRPDVLVARGRQYSVSRSADAYLELIDHGLRGGAPAASPYRAKVAVRR
jgi:glycosyltransferase involved in cell wall biosynthesis